MVGLNENKLFCVVCKSPNAYPSVRSFKLPLILLATWADFMHEIWNLLDRFLNYKWCNLKMTLLGYNLFAKMNKRHSIGLKITEFFIFNSMIPWYLNFDHNWKFILILNCGLFTINSPLHVNSLDLWQVMPKPILMLLDLEFPLACSDLGTDDLENEFLIRNLHLSKVCFFLFDIVVWHLFI